MNDQPTPIGQNVKIETSKYLDMHRGQLVGDTEFSGCHGEELREALAAQQEGTPCVLRHHQTPSLGHGVGTQPLEDMRDVRKDPYVPRIW